VYAAARRTERMAGLAGAGIRTLAMDLTVEEQMTSASNVPWPRPAASTSWSTAPVRLVRSLEEVPLSEARHQFEVNVFARRGLSSWSCRPCEHSAPAA